jgi:phage terminase small subunit
VGYGFKRRTPDPGKSPRDDGMVRIGDDWLDPQQAIFVAEFSTRFNGAAAAKEAGYATGSAAVVAHRLLQDPKVLRAVLFVLRQRQERIGSEGAQQGVYWSGMAAVDLTADHLDTLKVGACRHCHGIDHEHHYDDVEFRHALRDHLAKMMKMKEKDRVPFDEGGGPGYDRTAAPHPECPRCHGEGIFRFVKPDVRRMSPAERMLFNGYKVNRDGSIELKWRDRDAARLNYETLTGLRRPVRPLLRIDPEDVSPEQLEALLQDMQRKRLFNQDDVDKMIDVTPAPGGGERRT